MASHSNQAALPTLTAQGQDRPTVPSADEAHDHDHDGEHAFGWPEAMRIACVALAAAAVWFRLWEPFASISLIGVLGVVIGGWPIFTEAVVNIAARRMTMELSMTIAIVAATVIAEFFTALVITLFVLVASW